MMKRFFMFVIVLAVLFNICSISSPVLAATVDSSDITPNTSEVTEDYFDDYDGTDSWNATLSSWNYLVSWLFGFFKTDFTVYGVSFSFWDVVLFMLIGSMIIVFLFELLKSD